MIVKTSTKIIEMYNKGAITEYEALRLLSECSNKLNNEWQPKVDKWKSERIGATKTFSIGMYARG